MNPERPSGNNSSGHHFDGHATVQSVGLSELTHDISKKIVCPQTTSGRHGKVWQDERYRDHRHQVRF